MYRQSLRMTNHHCTTEVQFQRQIELQTIGNLDRAQCKSIRKDEVVYAHREEDL